MNHFNHSNHLISDITTGTTIDLPQIELMKKIQASENSFSEILLYTTPNGSVKVEIYLQNETIWLTQQKIADLFGVDRSVVTKHIGNIFKTGELIEEVVCANFAHTTQHGAIKGKTQESVSKYYNLDAIISVGYRVIVRRQLHSEFGRRKD